MLAGCPKLVQQLQSNVKEAQYRHVLPWRKALAMVSGSKQAQCARFLTTTVKGRNIFIQIYCRHEAPRIKQALALVQQCGVWESSLSVLPYT